MSPPVQVYGFHPVREALRHRPGSVTRVLVAGGRGGARRREVEALCRGAGVRCETVERGRLDELSGGAPHNGFLAELAAAAGSPRLGPGPRPATRTSSCWSRTSRTPGTWGPCCAWPRGPGWAGCWCATAAPRRSRPRRSRPRPAPPSGWRSSGSPTRPNHPRASRTTATGSTAPRPAGRHPGRPTSAARCCWCFGGEEKGMRRLTRELCDGLVGLPMRGRVESLNLATAAAAVLYDAVRQRREPRGGRRGGIAGRRARFFPHAVPGGPQVVTASPSARLSPRLRGVEKRGATAGAPEAAGIAQG